MSAGSAVPAGSALPLGPASPSDHRPDRRAILRHLARAGLAPLALAGGWPAAAQPPQAWRFAVFGDAPYQDWEIVQTRAVLRAAGARSRFLVHVGDVKGSREPCTDALLAERRSLLDESPVPLVFVPGDNEWTDCHRTRAGGFEPLERLRRLRALFFDESRSLGRDTMPLVRQSDLEPGGLPEHLCWQLDTVLFVTVNVAGSSDALRAGAAAARAQPARREAALRWLADGFERARAGGLSAVVIFAHANVALESESRPRPLRPAVPDPYLTLRRALLAHAAAFAGTTLFVHGDTHRFTVDRPFEHSHGLRRFVRLEVSGWPDVSSWVEVSVHPRREDPFEIELRRLGADVIEDPGR